MTLSAEQRRALEMLADAGESGSTLDMLVANRFPAELLADLVSDGLAMMQGETVKVDERTSEIIRVMITDAGLSAIEDRAPEAKSELRVRTGLRISEGSKRNRLTPSPTAGSRGSDPRPLGPTMGRRPESTC